MPHRSNKCACRASTLVDSCRIYHQVIGKFAYLFYWKNSLFGSKHPITYNLEWDSTKTRTLKNGRKCFPTSKPPPALLGLVGPKNITGIACPLFPGSMCSPSTWGGSRKRADASNLSPSLRWSRNDRNKFAWTTWSLTFAGNISSWSIEYTHGCPDAITGGMSSPLVSWESRSFFPNLSLFSWLVLLVDLLIPDFKFSNVRLPVSGWPSPPMSGLVAFKILGSPVIVASADLLGLWLVEYPLVESLLCLVVKLPVSMMDM